MTRKTLIVAMVLGAVLMNSIAVAWAQQQSASAGSEVSAGTDGQPAYDEKGAEGCLKCHDKPPATDILRTPHAVSADSRTPFAVHACETCHGPSPEHLEKPPEGQPRAPTAVSFLKSSSNSVVEQNTVCLNCHSGGEQMNWKGSPHHFAEMTCVSCHDIHVRKDPALIKTQQAEVCYDCHAETRAQSYRPYRHPIAEGLTACGDCHNAHGSSTEALLLGRTLNETCYNCHAELRGPFLWEHAPAREDCSYCHYSHGSVHQGLLKSREPFLCQECHMAPYHSSALYDGSRLGRPTAQRELLGRSCMNCHSQVHGSNHPSGVRQIR